MMGDHIKYAMQVRESPGLVEIFYPYPARNTYWHEACRTVWHWVCRDYRGADLVIVHGS